MNEPRMSIEASVKIINLLIDNGLSAKDLAAKLGTSVARINRIKRGDTALYVSEFGVLAGSVSKVVAKEVMDYIQRIKLEDMKRVAEDAKEKAAKAASEFSIQIIELGRREIPRGIDAAHVAYAKGSKASEKVLKSAAKKLGSTLIASGHFIKGLAGK
jgi:predicted TIM-barrel enzyme